jgi:hypothetical protein
MRIFRQTRPWAWRATAYLVLALSIPSVAAAVNSRYGNVGQITLLNYFKIHRGMTDSEVRRILGEPLCFFGHTVSLGGDSWTCYTDGNNTIHTHGTWAGVGHGAGHYVVDEVRFEPCVDVSFYFKEYSPEMCQVVEARYKKRFGHDLSAKLGAAK